MKFLVQRTSGWKDRSKKPCEEAELYKEDRRWTLWIVEIATIDQLVKFCDKYGEVVIMPKDIGEPYPTIEIYDDYRE